MVVASFTQRGVEVGPAGGHISVGAMPRSYQVTSVGPSHPMPALLLEANPKAADAKRARHQVIRNQPPHLGTCHDDTPPIRQLHPDTETQSVLFSPRVGRFYVFSRGEVARRSRSATTSAARTTSGGSR